MKTSPLIIIALVFAASFSGRAINFTSAAATGFEKPPRDDSVEKAVAAPMIAQATVAAPAVPATTDDAKTRENRHGNTRAAESSIDASLDRDVLLAAIRARSAALDRQEADMKDRQRVLEAIEIRLDQKTKELKSVKAELEERLVFADSAAQNDISRLARMYENMKPQKAGEIFNAMDATFAAGFLTEMNSESAALVLASMDTEKAYATSVIIAGRNANINRR